MLRICSQLARVEICGLINATSLNQQHGYIMSFNNSTSRYEVQLNEDGSTKYVKPEHVKRVDVFDFEGMFDESASEFSDVEG